MPDKRVPLEQNIIDAIAAEFGTDQHGYKQSWNAALQELIRTHPKLRKYKFEQRTGRGTYDRETVDLIGTLTSTGAKDTAAKTKAIRMLEAAKITTPGQLKTAPAATFERNRRYTQAAHEWLKRTAKRLYRIELPN